MANITGNSQLKANIRRYGDRTKASLLLFSDHYGKGTMEQYAKRNAIWTDRTNMARNSLNGGGFMSGDDIASYISGGVEYQYYLENISFGKWAILQPTVISSKNEWLKGIRKILKGN